MSLRDVLVFAPVGIGFLVGTYCQFQAFRNLREPRKGERLFTLFFGEMGVGLYTFEGHRYRVIALLAFIVGAALTIALDINVPR